MTTIPSGSGVESQIESLLRAGKSAQWISYQLGEPMQVCMAVLQRLRAQASDQPINRGHDRPFPLLTNPRQP